MGVLLGFINAVVRGFLWPEFGRFVLFRCGECVWGWGGVCTWVRGYMIFVHGARLPDCEEGAHGLGTTVRKLWTPMYLSTHVDGDCLKTKYCVIL